MTRNNQNAPAFALAGALWAKDVLSWQEILAFIVISLLLEIALDSYDKWRARRCPA